MTPEMKTLLDMLTYHADEPEHVEQAVDALIAGISSLGSVIGHGIPDRQEMIDYVIDQWS